MKRSSFLTQLWIAAGLVVAGFLLSVLLQNGIASNIGWVLAGLLFVLHPVLPQNQEETPGHLWLVRLAGAVVILVGVLVRFRV
ncbi:MAG: hypothetical protein LUE61_10240 [Clostridiales bacterium]|nr:hypothetical protein [Clostridiales bacterium]